jgi:hypothetical protein
MGNLEPQSPWCNATTFRICLLTVLMYCSTMPLDCGWKGVVHILFPPNHCNTSCIRQHLKLWPWSLCSSRGTPKWQKKLTTSTFATVEISGWEWCRLSATC